MNTLRREHFIGTWALVSYHETSIDDGTTRAPLGDDARGLLLYSQDGFMSAQLMRMGRPEFASGDWFDGSDEELRRASDYIAYAGPYTFDEDKGELTHGMDVSFFPNWLHDTQPRIAGMSGDVLTLSTVRPMRSGGRTVISNLVWKKAG